MSLHPGEMHLKAVISYFESALAILGNRSFRDGCDINERKGEAFEPSSKSPTFKLHPVVTT
jgi:hypothetical protein